MNDMVWMQNHQGVQDAPQNASCIGLSINSSFFDLIKKLFAVEVLKDQVNVEIWLEYFVQLQNVRMTYLSKQGDLIVNAEHTFDVVFEHLLLNCFNRKPSFGRVLGNIIYLCEISFTNDFANFVLATKVLEHTEVLE